MSHGSWTQADQDRQDRADEIGERARDIMHNDGESEAMAYRMATSYVDAMNRRFPGSPIPTPETTL